MSCGDVNKKKVSNKTNEKYYKIESIKEVDIVSEKIESYDTSKMKFIKGGKFIFGNDNGLERGSFFSLFFFKKKLINLLGELNNNNLYFKDYNFFNYTKCMVI